MCFQATYFISSNSSLILSQFWWLLFKWSRIQSDLFVICYILCMVSVVLYDLFHRLHCIYTYNIFRVAIYNFKFSVFGITGIYIYIYISSALFLPLFALVFLLVFWYGSCMAIALAEAWIYACQFLNYYNFHMCVSWLWSWSRVASVCPHAL
jgi:hypothetical protein